MNEQSAHELINFIDRRIAAEQGKDDAITRGYLLALRHIRDHIEREEELDTQNESHKG
jgi:hypothetical protein